MSAIPGIYENGIVRLLGPVDLPEGSRVEVVAKRVDLSEPSVPNLDQDEALDAIYEVLSERYSGGDPFVSARHNEHQP
jgi:predicted DNA-binding antitoxin AbrB/MazE fold protein